MKLDTDKMRWQRDRLGLSLAEVAERAEVAEGTVLRAEHGEDIRPSSGRRIARAFGVDISELIPEKPGRIEEPLPLGDAPGSGRGGSHRTPPAIPEEEVVAWLEENDAPLHAMPFPEFRDRVLELSADDLDQLHKEFFEEWSRLKPLLAEGSRLYSEIVDRFGRRAPLIPLTAHCRRKGLPTPEVERRLAGVSNS